MFELSLRNRLEDLSVLGEWLGNCAEQSGISERGIFRLQLVVEEAVTNIIQNAYLATDDHTIIVNLMVQENTIHVSIKDDGVAFDPLRHPEVVLPSNLEEAQVGGLGIHLMRRYTDTCNYQRKDNLNILTLIICDQKAKI
jgi:serine/threonine-protein kinase RsbW